MSHQSTDAWPRANARDKWSLWSEGRVITAVIIVRHLEVEAQIRLDGKQIYCRRHMSHESARKELLQLRRQWINEGWSEPR
jgi:hypothetical protein